MDDDEARRAQLEAGLAAVRDRITRACQDAGRDPGGVGLVVVTKTYPAEDVRALAALGVRDVGENRVQEGAAKSAEVADPALRWHQIGQLQTNKANSVGRWADVVHSVDRPRLVDALDRAAEHADRSLDCLIQVSLDGDTARGGALVDDVPALAERLAGTARLRLAGVMAVAPLDAPARQAFTLLAEVAARVRRDHPGADAISAGMSGDLEDAIACGATLLRVGTAILGSRPPLQ